MLNLKMGQTYKCTETNVPNWFSEGKIYEVDTRSGVIHLRDNNHTTWTISELEDSIKQGMFKLELQPEQPKTKSEPMIPVSVIETVLETNPTIRELLGFLRGYKAGLMNKGDNKK